MLLMDYAAMPYIRYAAATLDAAAIRRYAAIFAAYFRAFAFLYAPLLDAATTAAVAAIDITLTLRGALRC